MAQNRHEDLKKIYQLFQLVDNQFLDLKARWKLYITKKGEFMLMDEELAKKESKAIEDFIEFRQKSVDLVKKVFYGPQQ